MKLADAKTLMEKSIEAMKRSLNTIRTGRANASLLDRITVEYYGTETPLRSLATISTPDASTITIQPFDPSSLTDIEKSISLSDVGLVPNNDGSAIRLNIPPLTEERRKDFVKMAGKIAEEGKVAIRNIRRDAIDTARKQGKSGDISEDESKDLQDQIQGLTDKYTNQIDKILADKETEITTV
ncbi:ribosome recycling factor [Acaryochloris sp. 'Moss Beach']|uniref:ribosome recycling factor n=1 Tax=Acaryochloris TaxID=155977 RepID=UPI001BAE5FBC|nr:MULTISPECIES: ribosome recycling factor [Acaryochloris]QUY40784.1 ribosome recycling factor [Acaryochloris marina S15]UJB69963.1 ribosome recycling factor [Acaryochloris sp. 'Moss Beach']